MNIVLHLYEVSEVSTNTVFGIVWCTNLVPKHSCQKLYKIWHTKNRSEEKFQHDHLLLSQKGNGESNVSYLGKQDILHVPQYKVRIVFIIHHL